MSEFWRVDDAGVPAATLTNGTTNAGWTKLSDATNGTPGFGSYDFCQVQCGYDMFVAADPADPNTVWIGGSMAYDELYGPTPFRSNGRSVMRSTDKGVHFSDMTADATVPSGMHPDQHAIGFDPHNTGIAFVGSDGGLVRTSGSFVDGSSDCDNRPALTDPADLADCHDWLSSIPTKITSLNDGLATLQFQSVTVEPEEPARRRHRRHPGQRHVGVHRRAGLARVGRRRRRPDGHRQWRPEDPLPRVFQRDH